MKNYALIAVLSLLTLSGAIFMTMESAGYYSMLYVPSQMYIAWGAAILSETFQHILIMVPGSTKAQNRLFKTVALIIFGLTVVAAGYKIYRPVLQSLSQIERDARLAEILEQEINDSREDRTRFTTNGSKQKLNAAKSVNRRVESSKELKELVKKDTKKPLTLFEILHLFILRIAIQIATLSCAWKIGKIALKPPDTAARRQKRIIKRWRAKHLRKDDKFVGVVQFNDGTFKAATPQRQREYKTWNGALRFFNDTKYDGRIPTEPTYIYEEV